MLAEGFTTMRESIHHVKVLQEMVSQLNLQGQSDNMMWANERHDTCSMGHPQFHFFMWSGSE